ncbi:MAG: UDP-N-acetylmuramoyl-tripeptide--D-alanyl-D-alanine ligase [Brevinema sp.]
MLFTNHIFEQSLNTIAINNREFVIRYFSNDSRISSDTHLYCFIGIKGERFDGNDYFRDAYRLGVRVFILQKKPSSIPDDALVYLVEDTLEALASLAHSYRKNLQIPHVLITGSVGKTTTRLMLTAILKEKYPVHTAQQNWNNAIGVPLTVLATNKDSKISLLEAGMSAKGEIGYLSQIVNPDIAIITNIGYSHTEFLGGMDAVAEAKIEITEGMSPCSLLLVNKYDPYLPLFRSRTKGNITYFDPKQLVITKDLGLQGFEFQHKNYPEERFFCPIPGSHLLLNLSIIFALIDVLQIPLECIRKGLQNIHGLGSRMLVFTNKKGAMIIADCYNASLESFKAALDVLAKASGRKIAVIGSVLELGEQSIFVHQEIGKYLNQIKPDLILAVGEEIKITCRELKIPYCHFEHKEEIWTVLEKELRSEDTVLVKASNGIGLGVIVSCLDNI